MHALLDEGTSGCFDGRDRLAEPGPVGDRDPEVLESGVEA